MEPSVTKNNTASAPPSKNHAETHHDTNHSSKRPNSCHEGKFKCTITSDRLAQLRRIVEVALRDHKIFTIKGGWPVIRRELLKRNWLEKYEPVPGKKHVLANQNINSDDLVSNLPAKQDWESTTAYAEKCEKTIISRMLQNYDVDFYWSMKKEPNDIRHRSNSYKLINRFSRSLFSSKEGLALLLQQAYWHTEPGVAGINFPRCYVLGFPDHYNLFVDDFRMTACLGLLKFYTEKYDTKQKCELLSLEGEVPHSAIQFALDRCEDYIGGRKHVDIDKDLPRIWDHEWDDFLSAYYSIVHHKGSFHDFPDSLTLFANATSTLMEMAKFWPEYDIDGMKNIWILKPGNKCRGRGIQLIKNIAEVDKAMGLKLKYVVQKYIERPLIIYQTKFDIRQWFMVTSAQPLTIWMYRDSYLRFSSQIFSLNNFHESLHLTNHAVQCKYANMQERDENLPEDNMWDCHTFKAYLKELGFMEKWDEVIFPGMRQAIICAMLASQDTMDRRQNTFEVYGADFMLSEDFKPWLIEINCSPDMSYSTTVTSRLCPQCMEDVLKVVLDKKRDPKSHTGLFDLIYRQTLPKVPPYLGINLQVRGRKIFKRTKQLNVSEREKIENKYAMRLKRHDLAKTEFLKTTSLNRMLPKLYAADLYKGPVIEDLIEELQKSYNTDDSGVDFVPALDAKVLVKKKINQVVKGERVAKFRPNPQLSFKNHFVYRKRNVKEKCNTQLNISSSCSYLSGLLNWNNGGNEDMNRVLPSRQTFWEKDTVSILKGKTILFDRIDVNKNYCLNTCNFNESLPVLEANIAK